MHHHSSIIWGETHFFLFFTYDRLLFHKKESICMFYYLHLIIIVFAVSLDGFGVGITYGIRNIKITITALFIIMCCSGSIVLISMTLGHFVRLFLPPVITD